jgi:hypothetical protein
MQPGYLSEVNDSYNMACTFSVREGQQSDRSTSVLRSQHEIDSVEKQRI